MKRISIICLPISFIMWSIPSHAQFFKKLTKAVNNTVNTVSSEINTSVGSGGTSVKATHADLSAYSPVNVYTLKPGERFDFTESCLSLNPNITMPQIVIVNGNGRFFIGPNKEYIPVTRQNLHGCAVAKTIDTATMVDFEDYANHAPNIDAEATKNFSTLYTHINSGFTYTVDQGSREQMAKLEAKLKREKDSGVMDMAAIRKMAAITRKNYQQNNGPMGAYIHFGNKKYGPYTNVQSMMINKDKTKFVALVTPLSTDDSNASGGSGGLQIVTSEGQKIQYHFLLGALLPYGDFNHYRIRVASNKSGPMLSILNPETGEKIPIMNGVSDLLEVDKTTGALIQYIDHKVYVDGKLIEVIPKGTDLSSYNLFISTDKKHCAYWTYKGLYLPDGKVIDGVLSCKSQMTNGKKVLSWMVLGKDNKTLILCHEDF